MKENKKPKKKIEDNVIYVESDPELAEKNSERQQALAIKKKNAILFIILIAAIALLYTVTMGFRKYKGYKVLDRTMTDYENVANYIEYASNILKYTSAGVSYINQNGDTVWTAGVNMDDPIAASCEGYAVVADRGGNTVCVFDEKGQISSVTMPCKICDVDVASQGTFAVILESSKTNFINMYGKDGDIICEIQTTIDKSGYPLDIALSKNGEKIFASFINIAGTKVSNSLVAYNFGDVGQNANADRIVGTYTFEDEIFPKLQFLDNNTIVAFGTKSINMYSMKEKPSESTKIKVVGEIQSVFYSDKYFGIITNNGTAENPYLLITYDFKGKEKKEKSLDFNYDNVYADEKEIIISGGNRCEIIRKNGSVKFDCEMENVVLNVVPQGKKNQYIVSYADYVDVIKLKLDSGVSISKAVSEKYGDENQELDLATDTDAQ